VDLPDLREQFPIGSNVLLLTRDRSVLPPDLGDWAVHQWSHNLVVTSGKVLIARMLADESAWDTGITYCEVGTSATAPALTDTNIGTVTDRVAVIDPPRRTSNRVQFRSFFAAGDITANLQAVGLYGHSTATITNQTGELFAHAKINFDNSSGAKDLTIVYEVTFG
jgi:hypothetical protein